MRSAACFDVIVAGHTCLDIIPTLSGLPPGGPGQLVEVGPAELATGGAVANTGVALHILGIRTRLMGKISDDLFGQVLLQVIGGYSTELTQDMVIVRGEASSYTVVIDPPGVDRSFMHCPGLNHTFGADDVSYDLVAQARLFHFGYPPLMRRMYADGGQELSEMFRRAKATGATTTLDFGHPIRGARVGRWTGWQSWRGRCHMWTFSFPATTNCASRSTVRASTPTERCRSLRCARWGSEC